MSLLKLGYRPKEVIESFGSSELFEEAVAAGMLKPKIRRRKLVLYNAADVISCWEKMCRGDLPPPRPRKTPRKPKEAAPC